MKAIHNAQKEHDTFRFVVVYPKDTEKWKQFTTRSKTHKRRFWLLCIPKILKNESNSQQYRFLEVFLPSCCVSQRYWKMKAIHNTIDQAITFLIVVVYPKDTEKWKQFTTGEGRNSFFQGLLCIPKILKNESNLQPEEAIQLGLAGCCVSQRYWKMKAIHNCLEWAELMVAEHGQKVCERSSWSYHIKNTCSFLFMIVLSYKKHYKITVIIILRKLKPVNMLNVLINLLVD